MEAVGGGPERVAAAIYGTIIVTAVIAALSEDPAASAEEVLLAALLTSIVFWLAHAYAIGVGERAATTDRTRWLSPWALLFQEWPMLQASLIVTLPLVLGTVGILHRPVALRGAVVVGILELFVWGYVAGHHLGARLLGRLASGLLIALLGVAVALLKLLVH